MQAPTTAPTQYPAGEAAIAAFEQARAEMNPQEFGNELLSAAEQMEPAAVQEFRRAIEALNLPPEVIDALNQMVDTILAEPEKYDEIRANFIAEGVPEDLLPPTFDPAFFGALNLALDQMAGASMPMTTQQFAEGGIVSLKPIAKMLAAQGRNGDTMLAHITPAEARLLRRYGGSGTINPITGLPEFFLKKVFKAVGSALKSVGKAVSNTFKSIGSAIKKFTSSTIGRIVTTVALGFFLGPAAAGMLGVTSAAGVAAVSGFIGSAGSTLLAGGKLKDALKAGALGGLTAGAMAGVTGGMNAFQSGSYAGPTTVAGQVERFTDSLKSLGGTSGAPAEVTGQLQYSGQGQVLPGSAEIRGTAGFGAADVGAVPGYQYTPTDSLIKPGFDPNLASQATGDNIFRMPPSVANAPGAGTQVAGMASNIGPVPGTPPAPGAPSYLGMDLSSAQGAVGGPSYAGMDLSSAQGAVGGPSYAGMDLSSAQGAVGGPSYAGMDLSSAEGAIDIPNRSFMDTARGTYDKYVRPYTPGGIEERGSIAAQNAYDSTYNRVLESTRGDREAARIAAAAAQKAATPGVFAKYAPIVAAGTGLAYAAGAFDPKQPEPPGIVPRTTGFDLYNQDPTQYGVTPGGASTVYAPSSADYGVMGNPFMRPTFQVRDPREYLSPYGLASLAPRRFNTGGFAAGGIGSMAKKYPRRTGQISGPGTETSDSIPAMLSDGEFVMTAKAVRGAGGGSRREGAKRMYQMMRKFERKA
jgi:hypothetical protein